MNQKLEKILEKYGPELLHNLGNMLIDLANEDVVKATSVDYRDDIPTPKKDVPPNMMELVLTYKARIKELRGDDLTSLPESLRIQSEITTLQGVIDDLSAWLVYNY